MWIRKELPIVYEAHRRSYIRLVKVCTTLRMTIQRFARRESLESTLPNELEVFWELLNHRLIYRPAAPIPHTLLDRCVVELLAMSIVFGA